MATKKPLELVAGERIEIGRGPSDVQEFTVLGKGLPFFYDGTVRVVVEELAYELVVPEDDDVSLVG